MTKVRGSEIKRLRDLEMLIQELPGFINPKLNLEQYVTNANIAALMLWDAYIRGYVTGQTVLDLGCGTGTFSIPASIMGAQYVLCIDIDQEALKIVQNESENRELNNIDLLMADVRTLNLNRKFKVAFQNPPFGIWSNKGVDIDFLKVALNHAEVVYTIHKLSTLEYVMNKVNTWGYVIDIIDKAVMNIPLMYKHHRKRIHKVQIFIARIIRKD